MKKTYNTFNLKTDVQYFNIYQSLKEKEYKIVFLQILLPSDLCCDKLKAVHASETHTHIHTHRHVQTGERRGTMH